MTKSDLALNYKKSFNCAQAVLLAYKEELGLSEETLANLGSAFGLGMGGMKGDCGALCAAEMVLGLIKKERVSREARELFNEFESFCGSAICKDLKGIETGVILCSCENCVKNAVELLEKRL